MSEALELARKGLEEAAKGLELRCIKCAPGTKDKGKLKTTGKMRGRWCVFVCVDCGREHELSLVAVEKQEKKPEPKKKEKKPIKDKTFKNANTKKYGIVLSDLASSLFLIPRKTAEAEDEFAERILQKLDSMPFKLWEKLPPDVRAWYNSFGV